MSIPDNIDTYGLLKALCKYSLKNDFTSARIVTKNDIFSGGKDSNIQNNYIYMTVESFGILWGIKIYVNKISVNQLDIIEKGLVSGMAESYEITNKILLATCFSLLEIYWNDLYEKLHSYVNIEYDFKYFKNNLSTGDHFDMNTYATLCLGIFCLAGVDVNGGSLEICGKEYTLTYTSGDDLTLDPIGISWAYMGRELWSNMCSVRNSKK